ncbi:hypothetical protein [Streptomyces sp. NPDC050504]|uniref:hypothetical protein n=1 Tax=Streptomyces sp. NPDC050504 TaxID=3365618 RepID=UPI0037AFB706
MTTHHTDQHFGDLTVALDGGAGALEVSGPALPTVRLVRAPGGGDPDPHVPVGTRDASRLTLTVDGERARLTAAKGRLTRRSYRVTVAHGGTKYRLTPSGWAESTLTGGRRKLASCMYSGEGPTTVEWLTDTPPTPEEAALAYALATAFGTGAQPMWATVTDFVGELIP